MGTPAWKKVQEKELEASRWRSIATALSMIAADYKKENGITATVDIGIRGVTIATEVDGKKSLELLRPNEVAQFSPEAYTLLHRARAIGANLYKPLRKYY